MLGSRHRVSHVSVPCWSNGNTTLFSLSGSEIRDCILLSIPEGIETRSWLKSYRFKGFLFPDVCINWETNWGEKILWNKPDSYWNKKTPSRAFSPSVSAFMVLFLACIFWDFFKDCLEILSYINKQLAGPDQSFNKRHLAQKIGGKGVKEVVGREVQGCFLICFYFLRSPKLKLHFSGKQLNLQEKCL